MKKLLTTTGSLLVCLFLWGFVNQSVDSTDTITIKGKVSTVDDEPLIGATILLAGTRIGAISDIYGKYELTCPLQTILVLKCSYTGYKNIIKTIKIEGKTELIVDFQLTETATILEEVAISGSARVSKKRNKKSSKRKSSASEDAEAPSFALSAPSRPIKSDGYYLSSPILSDDAKVISSPSPKETYEKTGLTKKEVESRFRAMSDADEMAMPSPTSTIPTHHAGTLTAGEIHDFSKWELWQDVAAEDLNEWVDTWNYHLTERYVVQVLTEDGFPVIDAGIDLRVGEKTIWTARTDNTGKAELWANVFNKKDSKAATTLQAHINYNGKKHRIEQVKTFQEGINFLRLEEACQTPQLMDIMFVVDATSSMRDELSYIQAELYDVIQRVQELRKETVINLGSVFYRDEGDEYLTRKSDLSADIGQTVEFIKQQSTAGGGDYPEAVESALQVAIDEMTWSDHSLAKLLFLVLDAPPHETPAILQNLERLTKKASAKGIRIIPIASSGINKSTEYLLRSFALSTNGTYVFLTDHSGVGNPHIEPSTDEYEVEKLNDLLIRVIKQFTQTVDCEQTIDPEVLQANNDQNQTPANAVFKCYPNPNQGVFTVDLEKSVKELFITDASGKNLLRFTDVQEGKTRVDLSNFPSGMYFVRCLQEQKLITEKVVVIGEGMVRNN